MPEKDQNGSVFNVRIFLFQNANIQYSNDLAIIIPDGLVSGDIPVVDNVSPSDILFSIYDHLFVHIFCNTSTDCS